MNVPLTGETARSFFSIFREQPIVLAMIVMNFALIGYLFYAGSSQLSQRQETAAMIVKWQQDTDKLMAGCVSSDVIKLVLDAVQKVIDTENSMRALIERQSRPPTPITPP